MAAPLFQDVPGDRVRDGEPAVRGGGVAHEAAAAARRQGRVRGDLEQGRRRLN